jgi:RHS repeat-associated protein
MVSVRSDCTRVTKAPPTRTACPTIGDAEQFGGHEAVPNVGLVNMNARLYDPVLGRFLSADSEVQFSGDLQSYNRYTYAMNNPLSYTDPTGHGIFSHFDTAFNGAWGVSSVVICVGSEGTGCGPAVAFMGALLGGNAMRQAGASYGQTLTAKASGSPSDSWLGSSGERSVSRSAREKWGPSWAAPSPAPYQPR